jgi:cytochrome c biogenesis protein CcmG, thiol:disulfide interchange protein DsbE
MGKKRRESPEEHGEKNYSPRPSFLSMEQMEEYLIKDLSGTAHLHAAGNKAIAFCCAALFALVFFGAAVNGEQTARFTLTTVDGNREPLDEILKKGPLLITFWASWCKSCKEELQALDMALPDQLRNASTIAAVTIDTPRSMMHVRSYIEARKMKLLFCTDPNSELLKQFAGKAIPYTVIIDTNRNIVIRHMGYSPGDEKKLLEILRKSSPERSSGTTPVTGAR